MLRKRVSPQSGHCVFLGRWLFSWLASACASGKDRAHVWPAHRPASSHFQNGHGSRNATFQNSQVCHASAAGPPTRLTRLILTTLTWLRCLITHSMFVELVVSSARHASWPSDRQLVLLLRTYLGFRMVTRTSTRPPALPPCRPLSWANLVALSCRATYMPEPRRPPLDSMNPSRWIFCAFVHDVPWKSLRTCSPLPYPPLLLEPYGEYLALPPLLPPTQRLQRERDPRDHWLEEKSCRSQSSPQLAQLRPMGLSIDRPGADRQTRLGARGLTDRSQPRRKQRARDSSTCCTLKLRVTRRNRQTVCPTPAPPKCRKCG